MRATSSRHQSSSSAGCRCSSAMASRTRRTSASSPASSPASTVGQRRIGDPRRPGLAARVRSISARTARVVAPARAPAARRVSGRSRACSAASGANSSAPRRPSPDRPRPDIRVEVGAKDFQGGLAPSSAAASSAARRSGDSPASARLRASASPSSTRSSTPDSCASAVSRWSSETGRSGRPVSASIGRLEHRGQRLDARRERRAALAPGRVVAGEQPEQAAAQQVHDA